MQVSGDAPRNNPRTRRFSETDDTASLAGPETDRPSIYQPSSSMTVPRRSVVSRRTSERIVWASRPGDETSRSPARWRTRTGSRETLRCVFNHARSPSICSAGQLVAATHAVDGLEDALRDVRTLVSLADHETDVGDPGLRHADNPWRVSSARRSASPTAPPGRHKPAGAGRCGSWCRGPLSSWRSSRASGRWRTSP